MARGGRGPSEGAEDLSTAGEDTGMGGRQPTGLRDVLQGGGTGGSLILVRDVGADPPHMTVPQKLPEQGCQADYGEVAKATGGWGVVLPTTGHSNRGGGGSAPTSLTRIREPPVPPP